MSLISRGFRGRRLAAGPTRIPPGSTLTRVAEALGEDGLHYEFDRAFEADLNVLVNRIEAVARN